MGRYLLGALGLVIVAVIGLVLWDLASSRDAPAVTAGAGVAEARAPADVAARADTSWRRDFDRRPSAGGDDAGPVAGVALVEDVGEHWTETLLAGDVPQEILGAAARCYRGEPGKREEMTVLYTVRIRDGAASLREVSLASSNVADARLEQCVLDTLRSHTWRNDDAPDVEHPSQIAISINALRRHSEPSLAEKARLADEQGDSDGDGEGARPPPTPLNP